MNQGSIVLSNDLLTVDLDPGKPVVLQYIHAPTGRSFGGGSEDGTLRVNGEAIPWTKWDTSVDREEHAVTYRMRLLEENLSLTWRFALQNETLTLRLDDVDDSDGVLREIGWVDLPLLVCRDQGFDTWRMFTEPPDPSVGHKMWATDTLGSVAEVDVEENPTPVIYGTIWNDAVCAFVDSNYPLFPITHQKCADGSYALSLNTYQYRVREKTMPPLEATVGFLGDTNGDGRADISDFRLWINRSRPPGDPLYYDRIAYKIFLYHALVDGSTCCTDLDQAEEIIRAFYHLSDGLPQLIYLVGQQAGGHDGTYPTLGGGTEPKVGTEARLRKLAKDCKEKYNALLSYHTNIDDAYRHSADWDDRFVVTSGSPGRDAPAVTGSICHTRDVETGEIFRRLEEYMACFPVEQTLHVDNLRLTNTVGREGWEDIGILEELVCGVMPVMDWLKERGITTTTEGYNGMPIDPGCIVSGFFHHDPPDRMRQILHRRISGGGRGSHFGKYTVRDYGICNNFHIDITGQKWPPDDLAEDLRERHFAWMAEEGIEELTWNLKDHGKQIVDCLYLGALLHHFYNEREMLIWDDVGEGHRLTFADDVVAEVCIESEESLRVTMGDVTVADGNDRFIPRGDAVFAYSKEGSDRRWRLPPNLRGKELKVCTLGVNGRGPAPDYELYEDGIRLKLEAGVPVKLVKDEEPLYESEPGDFTIIIGRNAKEELLRATLTVTAELP